MNTMFWWAVGRYAAIALMLGACAVGVLWEKLPHVRRRREADQRMREARSKAFTEKYFGW